MNTCQSTAFKQAAGRVTVHFTSKRPLQASRFHSDKGYALINAPR